MLVLVYEFQIQEIFRRAITTSHTHSNFLRRPLHIISRFVDSGADFCIFDSQIGELLGIDIYHGESRKVSGITGTVEDYYIHTVTLHIGGWPYKVSVGFLPNIASLGYGVVGQKGFFDLFVVQFDLLKEEIELKERRG